MGKVCELQFFGSDPIFEPITTPTFESRLDLSHIPESVLVHGPFKLKSIILHNYTSLLDKGVEQNDLRNIFENWNLNGDKFLNITIHFYIILLGHSREVTGGFLRYP